MSRKIYSALTEQFIRRMRNWALTNAGCAGEQRVISSIYHGENWDTYGDAPMPVLIGEAEDVSNALVTIRVRYRQAVSLFWQYEGRPLTWFASRSGQGVDYRTFETRVMHGHELLKAELMRQREKVESYRVAVRAKRTEQEIDK